MPPVLKLPFDLLLILLLLHSFAITGLGILRFFPGPKGLDRFFLGLGLGMSAQAMWTWGVGTAGLWSGFPLVVGIFLGLALGGPQAFRFLRGLPQDPEVRDLKKGMLDPLPVALILLAALGFSLIFNYSPSLSDDSTVSYLGFPILYAEGTPVWPWPDKPFSYFPQTIEMLFTQGMTLGTPATGKLFNWVFLVLNVLVLGRIAQKIDSGIPVAPLGALYALMPSVSQMAGTGKIDLGFQFFALLAVLAFLDFREKGGWKAAALTGLLAGAHFSSKYFGVFLIAGLGFRMLWVSSRREKAPDLIAQAFSFLGGILLIALPPLLRNFRLTGNPIYPSKVGSLNHDAYLAHFSSWKEAPSWFGFDLGTVFGVFDRIFVQGISEGIGPLLPALLAPALYFLWKDRNGTTPFKDLAWISAFSLGIFVILYPYAFFPRYFVIPFLLMLPLMNRFLGSLFKSDSNKLRIGLFSATLLFPGLFLPATFAALRGRYLSGAQSSEQFLETRWRNCEDWGMRNRLRALPKGTGVLLTYGGQVPVYHYPDLDLRSLAAYPFSFYGTPSEEAAKRLRSDGIEYVLTCPKNQIPRLEDGTLEFELFGFSLAWFSRNEGNGFKRVAKTATAELYEVVE